MYIGDQIRYNYVARNLPVNKTGKKLRCLDLGCGDKKYKEVLESKGYEYTGLDKPAIDLNNENEIIELINHGFYALVLCVDVLEHLADPFKTLSYLPDLLDTHGHLIIHVPNKYQTHIMIEPEKNTGHTLDGFSTEEIRNELEKFFRPENLKIIPTFKWNEAVAWDLSYIIRNGLSIERAIENALSFDASKFQPYGILIIGEI